MIDGTGLRVVQVVCTDAFAGVERYVTTLSRGLAERGCEVVVLGGERARMPDELPAAVEWRGSSTVAAALAQLVHERSVDLVHAHMTKAELAAVLGRLITRVPVVCTRHFAQHRGSSVAARLLGPLLTRSMACQLSISKFVARTTEGASVVVPPGVPNEPTLPADGREPVVLLAQRLEPEKRTELAIDVWAASRLADSGWRMLIAGDGRERDALQDRASKLGVSASCDWLGPRRDVPALLGRASIFLASRPDEPFGLSVVEAMAAGVPVVAVRGGGHDETVGRAEDPALFPPDEPAVGGDLLAALAADPARRIAYGAQLQAIQRREFTVDRQVEQTLAAYRAVLH